MAKMPLFLWFNNLENIEMRLLKESKRRKKEMKREKEKRNKEKRNKQIKSKWNDKKQIENKTFYFFKA